MIRNFAWKHTSLWTRTGFSTAVVLVVLLGAASAGADRPYQSMDQLIVEADGFVLGTIRDVLPFDGEAYEGGDLLTLEEIEVTRGLEERIPHHVYLPDSGGPLNLVPGERTLLLLRAGVGDVDFELVGGPRGIFRIVREDQEAGSSRDLILDHDGNRIFGLMGGHLITEYGLPAEAFHADPNVENEGEAFLLPPEKVDLSGREPMAAPVFIGLFEQKLASVFDRYALEGQILAEAACTAMRPTHGWTFAVQRRCSNYAPDCAKVCNYIYEGQAGWLTCFNSLHVYANQAATGTEVLGLKTYRYNGCGGSCGPNYCCCGN